MTVPAVVIRGATLAEILPLRHAVLRPGRPRATAEFDGDDEPATRHLAAFCDGACVSCLTLMVRPIAGEPAWQLRGMATRADCQRSGLGAALLRAAEAGLRPDEPRVLWCNARVDAVAFYERLGWRVVSDVFDVPDVGPHHRMERRL